jgi:hypothetical protein
MSAALNLNAKELAKFATGLDKHFHGRMQYRNGFKEDIRSFCIVRVAERVPYKLEGHLSGPSGNNAKFSLTADAANGQVFLHVRPEAPAGYPRELALTQIIDSLNGMAERTAKGPVKGRIGMKGWRGFYLTNLGQRKIGKDGLVHFEDALVAGVISPAFKDSAIDYGFTMKHVGNG